MRCYYEVLNVARDADDGEIKTAYRKMALKWHPDKNLDDLVNAKEQFQIVQQAYEVLSDKQERAWYDRHREQIIRSGNPEVNDDHLDVFQYFTTSCFKDYNDDEMGFYTVYRNLFDQIAKEDMDYYENKEEFMNIPSFGNSNSEYDEIVNPFYAHWMSYSTKKSYVWLDPYNIKDIRDRRLLKAVEKENKKSRQKAKKERNDEIRNLVMFVRKRDKRVQAWNKLNEAKIEENRKKQDVIRKQKLEERRKMNESQVQAEWTKFENVSSELTEIEKNLEKQFGNSDSSDLEEYNDLYCAACNKLFKTEKSFQNHESSKKHKENIQALKEQLLEEDEEYENIDSNDELDEEEIEIVKEVLLDSISKTTTDESSLEEEIDTPCSNINKTEIQATDSDSSDADFEQCHTKRPNKLKKNRNVLKVESTDDEMKLSFVPSSDDDFNTPKKGKKKSKPVKMKKTLLAEKKPKSKVNQCSSSKKEESEIQKNDTELFLCSTCKKDYPSKNKLFQHLRKEGHSIYLPSSTTIHNKSTKKK